MGVFSQVIGATLLRPVAIVTLAPKDWHAEWETAPRVQSAVGIRLLSDADTTTAKAEALKFARQLYPGVGYDDDPIVEAYNDALMRLAVARAACDPNDATVAYFRMPEDDVPLAWTPATIRRVWDELERATIANSAVRSPADDEQITELCVLIERGLVGTLATSQELRMRKILGWCLEELQAVAEIEG